MSTSYEHLVETTPARDASGDKPSRSPGYRHVKHKEPPRCEYASTLYEIFQHSVKEHGEKPCLGHRPKNKDGLAGDYTFLTYSEVADKVKAFAASLRAAGVRKPERLAVFGTNCPEWMIAMQVRMLTKRLPRRVGACCCGRHAHCSLPACSNSRPWSPDRTGFAYPCLADKR